MALKIIVSYDDTDNDRDALALGRLLAISGGELSPTSATPSATTRLVSSRRRSCWSAVLLRSVRRTWAATSSSTPLPASA